MRTLESFSEHGYQDWITVTNALHGRGHGYTYVPLIGTVEIANDSFQNKGVPKIGRLSFQNPQIEVATATSQNPTPAMRARAIARRSSEYSRGSKYVKNAYCTVDEYDLVRAVWSLRDVYIERKAILHVCLILSRAVLCCVILSYLVWHCLVLSRIVVYCIVMYWAVVFCVVLHCVVLYCIVLHCTVV